MDDGICRPFRCSDPGRLNTRDEVKEVCGRFSKEARSGCLMEATTLREKIKQKAHKRPDRVLRSPLSKSIPFNQTSLSLVSSRGVDEVEIQLV